MLEEISVSLRQLASITLSKQWAFLLLFEGLWTAGILQAGYFVFVFTVHLLSTTDCLNYFGSLSIFSITCNSLTLLSNHLLVTNRPLRDCLKTRYFSPTGGSASSLPSNEVWTLVSNVWLLVRMRLVYIVARQRGLGLPKLPALVPWRPLQKTTGEKKSLKFHAVVGQLLAVN